MKLVLNKFLDTYFRDSLDYRARVFNTLGFLGSALGVFLAIFSAYIQAEFTLVLANFFASVFAVILIVIANRTQRFRLCFLIAVVGLFIVLFPIMFFSGGGYYSSMPGFFVFAIVFTILMLEGRSRALITVLEFILYGACFIVAFVKPEKVTPFASEVKVFVDIAIGCLTASAVLAIAIYQHIIVYDRKLKELGEANAALLRLNRTKTEFLQDIRHEIQNPLQVISLGADLIRDSVETCMNKEITLQALNDIQNEALRLGRMISGMVELATMSRNPQSRERVDFAELLSYCVEASRIAAEQKANRICIHIAEDLADVYAEAEQLKRVPINLIANANAATSGGEITVEAFGGLIYNTVRISDNGEGISPDLLPLVLQRGVSGKGGKGYGLSICKTIIEAHGGSIAIESKLGCGTIVTFTLPVYGGQLYGGQHG